MRLRALALCAAIVGMAGTATFAAGAAAGLREELLAIPFSPDLGGETTRVGGGQTAFTFLAQNAEKGRARDFFFGNRLFNTNWVQAPGSVKTFADMAGVGDFDGNGLPDFVIEGANGKIQWATSPVPNRLVAVNRASGGRTEVTYTASSQQATGQYGNQIPTVQQLLKNAQSHSTSELERLQNGGAAK